MVSLFRKNLFINSILLLPYIFVLRLKTFFVEESGPLETHSILSKWVYDIGISSSIQAVLQILILFFNALLINRMVIKNNLLKENTLIAGMLYILFSSMLNSFLHLSDVMMSSTFLILATSHIFTSYNNVKSADDIFLSGFYISISSLFYFPIIFFVFFGYIALTIMRSFTAKERIQYLLGVITAYFLIIAIQYFKGDYNFAIPYYFINQIGFSQFYNRVAPSDLITVIFTILIGFYFVVKFGSYMGKKIIVVQKRINILYLFLFFTLLIPIFYRHIQLSEILLFCIPSSIFICSDLLDMKNRIFPEIIHLMLILLLVINHLELIKF